MAADDAFRLADQRSDNANSDEGDQKKIDQARQLAVLCVAFCTFSMLSACLAVPALLTASLSLQSELQLEADFCHVRLRDVWSQIATFGDDVWRREDGAGEEMAHMRGKRAPKDGAWLFGRFISDVPTTSLTTRPRAHAAPLAEPQAPIPSGGEIASGTSAGGYGGYGATGPARAEVENGGETGQAAPPKADMYGMEISGKPPPPSTALAQGNTFSGASNAYATKPFSAALPPSIKPTPASDQTAFCCCCQGSPGAPGDAGDDGEAGKDGLPGSSGLEGRSGEIIAHDAPVKEPCVICPQGLAGPAGPQGPRGPPGPRGANGNSGVDGRENFANFHLQILFLQANEVTLAWRGRQVQSETLAQWAPRGHLEFLAVSLSQRALGARWASRVPKGPKGMPGCQGVPGVTIQGVNGTQGDPGRPGKDGRRGQQGANGTPGFKGTAGDCFHCPTPRTPPGYY
uniref:Col_cuticle_N domain-containing protein n=1 Tax=Globodera pallida TaxID=36090 RepID=A0A183C352_GLOPA